MMGVKTTLILDEKLFSQAKQLIRDGMVKSMSYLVEIALYEHLERLKQEAIRAQIRAAGKDPMVLADIEEITTDFSDANSDEGTK